jgi:preprotein translocase subunit SecA
VDYVVERDRIALVDQSTGRVFADRSWRNGLHQAVEAKEKLPITPSRRTLARMSRQQFFRRYRDLCGMTGTARGASRELWEIYRLRVMPIPTRRPCRRVVLPPRFFTHKAAKFSAIAAEIRSRHDARQPVLVGTRTIEESCRLAEMLSAEGLTLRLLNGTQDMAEAAIIQQAGQAGAVTIATNIAGRGTDIRLGAGVAALGGLHVVASEPHASQRVDLQLMGRAARQGDPGSCQLFVSAEDELIRVFGSTLARTMRRLASPDGEIREDLSPQVRRVQERVERLGVQARRHLLRMDAWTENVLARMSGKGLNHG